MPLAAREYYFMAETIFDCPNCKQAIQADVAWAGQQIQCPLCQAAVTVPAAEAPAPAAGIPRFAGGSAQVPRSASGVGISQQGYQPKPVKKKSPAAKYAVIGTVAVAVVVAGVIAWPHVRPHLPFLNKSEDESAKATAAANAPTPQAESTPAPAPAPVPQEKPMTAPIHTLDVQTAKISEGKVNGMIAGTNFVPDHVRLEKMVGGYVLDLRQGTGATPDRGMRVYLRLGATESPTGHTWTVSSDLKDPAITRIVKVWKPNPKYAAQEKSFFTGFALKLEFGQLTESNTIPGKIFAALPDPENSVIGGVFSAVSTTAGAAPTPAQTQPTPAQPARELSPEFQKRYGVKR